MPRRARMSITVTMRPRRLRTPAISPEAKGTRVTRSGMNTSCTREIGRPNNWPPIMAVTYSETAPSTASILLVMLKFLRRYAVHFGGLFLERRDQSRTIELRNVVVEPGLTSTLDRRRRNQRRQRDDRHRREVRVGADRLGEFEAVHVGHLDIGQHRIERLSRAQRRKPLLRVRRSADLVARGLQHRRQLGAEESVG